MPLNSTDDIDIGFSPELAPESASGMRAEDVLRLLLTSGLILIVGLVLGAFTFRELEGRGTGYFVIALCLAVMFTALAYFKFELALALFVSAIWINFGGTPDLAQGVSSGTGKAVYPVELGAMFLIFMWFLRGVVQGNFRLARTPMNVPLGLYLAFSVWTAVNGYLFWDPALTRFYAGLPNNGRTAPQVIVLELMLRVLSLGMFWLTANSLSDPKWLRRISLLFLLPGALICLAYYHVLPGLAGGFGVMEETVTACALLAWLLETHGRRDRYSLLRIPAWLFLGLIVFQVFVMGISWISGWLCLLAGLFFVTFLKSRKLFVGLIGLSLILALIFTPLLKMYVVHDVETSGDMDRFSMMRAALLYATHFPLGIGPGNYRAYNAYYGGSSMWNTTGYTSAHDFYAQALSEMGFLGLALTLLWVVVGVVMVARLYRRAPPGFSRILLLALAGMWAGICAASVIGDYLIPVYHNGGLVSMTSTIYSWIGLGIAAAYGRMMEAPEAASPASAPAPPPPSIAQYYPRRLSP